MNLPFYQNAVKHGMVRQPEEMYRQAQQAVQDDLWENTAILDEIEEQDDFGPLTFHKVEAWLAPVVGVSSTGLILAPLQIAKKISLTAGKSLELHKLQHSYEIRTSVNV